MARGRSLFGDPTSEIQTLTLVIKDDIAKLNSDIASLQQLTRNQVASGRTGKHTKSHSGAVVISLQVNEHMYCHSHKMIPIPKYLILRYHGLK